MTTGTPSIGKSRVMMKTLALSAPAVLWLLMFLLGLALTKGVLDQDVAGYPNASQIGYYVVAPCLICAALIGLAANAKRLSGPVCVIVTGTALLALPVYLFLYTGGV